jgi:hypothetical protein
MKIRTKSYIEKLLPELKPNSEPMLMCIASAPILQNPMLCAANLQNRPFGNIQCREVLPNCLMQTGVFQNYTGSV